LESCIIMGRDGPTPAWNFAAICRLGVKAGAAVRVAELIGGRMLVGGVTGVVGCHPKQCAGFQAKQGMGCPHTSLHPEVFVQVHVDGEQKG
jgi:hypothetical protein